MLKLTITKRFSWAMAHMLENHDGLCKSLHGHEYQMDVTIRRMGRTMINDNSSKGMVLDFSKLKEIVNEVIISKLDHAFAYNFNNKLSSEIGLFLANKNMKVFPFPFRTTAENMAIWIMTTLNIELIKLKVKCCKVALWETPTSYAVVEK